MPSLIFEKPTKEKPKGRWVLQYNIWISGFRKDPPPRIKRVSKSDITKALQFAVNRIEQASKSGIATSEEIDTWVNGYREFGLTKPLISPADAALVWPGYRDHIKRTNSFAAVELDMNLIVDKYLENAKNKTRKF